MKINGHDRFIEDKKIKCFWQQLGTKGVCVCDCVCWSLWHAEKLLFSCLCSKVTVYRFICWNGPKSCQIQPKPVNSLPSQTQACALFLNLQAKPSQARNPFFVIQAKPSRLGLAWLGLFLGDSKPAWWPLQKLFSMSRESEWEGESCESERVWEWL